MNQYIIFEVASQKIALHIEFVERVTRVVAIKSIGQVSEHILGVIDVQGTMLSVVNFRTLLGLPSKEIELSDILLICEHQDSRYALLVDHVLFTEFCDDQDSECPSIVPKMKALERFVKTESESLPCYSLEALFKEVEHVHQPSG